TEEARHEAAAPVARAVSGTHTTGATRVSATHSAAKEGSEQPDDEEDANDCERDSHQRAEPERPPCATTDWNRSPARGWRILSERPVCSAGRAGLGFERLHARDKPTVVIARFESSQEGIADCALAVGIKRSTVLPRCEDPKLPLLLDDQDVH